MASTKVKAIEMKSVVVRLPTTMVEKIDEFAALIRQRTQGGPYTRSDALRDLVLSGLTKAASSKGGRLCGSPLRIN